MENKKITTLTLPVQTEKGVMNQTYDLHPLWDNIEEAPAVYDKIYEILNDKQTKDSINSSKRIRNDQEMEYALLSMSSSLPNYSDKEVMFYTRYDQNPDASIPCTFPEGDWLVRFVKRASEVYITATQGDITLYRVYNEPIKNFSFEDNIFPPHWDTNNSNIVSLTGLEAQSGTYCMKISDPGGHLYSSTIIIPRPNETYGASMWIKGEAIEGLNPAPVYLQLEFFDVYLNSLGRSKSAWTKEWTSDWQQIILTNIAVPANAVSMRIVASSSPASEGCIYFDNFNLFISNQEDNNLLKEYNPDFETVVDIPGWPRTNGDYRKYIEILVDDRSISLNNGNRVMKISASGVWVYSDPISLKANVSYTFSANVWGTGAALHLSEDKAILKEGVSRTQDGNTQILTYTPDSDKDIYLVITTGSASAIVYVDNVLFAPTENYMNKSSVEIALSEWKEISASNSTLKHGEGIDSMIPATTQGATGTGDENDPGPVASGHSAVALGRYTRAIGDNSHAEGHGTIAGTLGFNLNSIRAGDTEGQVILELTSNPEAIASFEGYVGTDIVTDISSYYAVDDIVSIWAWGHMHWVRGGSIVSINDEAGEITCAFDDYTGLLTPPTESSEDKTDIVYFLSVYHKPLMGVIAQGEGAWASGFNTSALALGSHTEGYLSKAIGYYGHAEGHSTISQYCGHAEGYGTRAYGAESHAEGLSTVASGSDAHAEGTRTTSSGRSAHAEGERTIASGQRSHVEGYSSQGTGDASHAEGQSTVSGGQASHAEGFKSQATSQASHAEGRETTASGTYAHSEGYLSIASGTATHAEGRSEALGNYSHSEGYFTKIVEKTAVGAHAEGYQTLASNSGAHAEGNGTKAYGSASHAEGISTTTNNTGSHAEGGYTDASYAYSHAEGLGTQARSEAGHVQGKYNLKTGSYAHIIGNGTSDTERSNAHTVDWNGNAWYAGKVTAGANPTEAMDLVTKEYIDTLIAALPKIYSGTEEPDNFEGKDGDIYIMYEE